MKGLLVPDGELISALAVRAADARLPRPGLHAELAASAVEAARHLTGELLTYDLARDIRLPAADDEPHDRENDHGTARWRHYAIVTVTWKTGRLGRRQRHTHELLVRQHNSLKWTAFWDPQNPERTWDTEHPPELPALGGLDWHEWLHVTLANGDQLARMASDAVPIMQHVSDRAVRRTQRLKDGARDADHALGLLAPTADAVTVNDR